MASQTESSGSSSGGPAVVYFAKAPVSGQVKTRLCPPLSADEAAALYAAFLRRVVRPVAGVRTLVYGWPGEALDSIEAALAPAAREGGVALRPQRGAGLWERMAGCFDELFAAGHGPVLIRNTDSPDLEIELVERAIAESGPGRVVLGPDSGGGYYLIALAEPCPALFSGVLEGAASVFAATRQLATDAGLEVVELPERGDVDTFDDLVAMWRRRLAR